MTRTRRLAVFTAAVLVPAVLVAAVGCGSGPERRRTPYTKPSSPSALGGTGAPAVAADKSCRPEASLRPVGALPPPGRMPAGTYMADIQKRGRLILGTSQDTLLFSSRNPFTGAVEGFDVDMAREISRAIFGSPDRVQIRVVPHESRVEWVEDGKVDLVINTMTANCERRKRVEFSTIYYQATQKVLVNVASKVERLEDLAGRKVCSAVGSTSLENLGRVKADPPLVPVSKHTFGDCLVAFQRNEVDAISTDDTILAGMAAQDPYAKVVGPRHTEEPYGMAISKKNESFTRFVNAVLERIRADGTWTALYKKWLGELGGTTPKPPVAQYR